MQPDPKLQSFARYTQPWYPKFISGKKYLLFDLETTGFSGAVNQIVQFGSMLVEGTTLEAAQPPVGIKVQLDEESINLLEAEVKSNKTPGYESQHFVLALTGYHPLIRPIMDILQDQLDAGLITQEEFENRTEGALDEYIDPVTGYQTTFKVPHKITMDEFLQVKADNLQRVPEKEALEIFLQTTSIAEGKFAGHNVLLYDIPFLNARLRKYGLPELKVEETLDTLWYCRLAFLPLVKALDEAGDPEAHRIHQYLLNQYSKPLGLSSRLQELRESLAVDGGLAHDAVGDVFTNLNVLKVLVSFITSRQDSITKEIAERTVTIQKECFLYFQEKGFRR